MPSVSLTHISVQVYTEIRVKMSVQVTPWAPLTDHLFIQPARRSLFWSFQNYPDTFCNCCCCFTDHHKNGISDKNKGDGAVFNQKVALCGSLRLYQESINTAINPSHFPFRLMVPCSHNSWSPLATHHVTRPKCHLSCPLCVCLLLSFLRTGKLSGIDLFE